MKTRRSLYCIVFAAVASCSLQADPVTLSSIYVSIGPDPNTSPSYAAYTANAQAGVAAGGVNEGGNIGTTPSAFNVIGTGSTVSGASITNTPFSSWLGVADPTGALTGEKGNYLFWSIMFTGTNISLNNITVTQSSSDPQDYFGNGMPPNGLTTISYAGQNYSTDAVGITSSNAVINSGAGTQQVDKIILTGFGAAQDGYGFNFTGTDAQQLQQIDDAFFNGLGSYSISTCFYYGSATSTNPNSCDSGSDATGIVNNFVSSAPEPRSFTCLAAALSLLLVGRISVRRRA